MRKGEGGREGDGEWWGSRREEGGRGREGDGVGEGGGEEGERQKEGGGRKEGGRRREKGGCGAGDHLFATDCISCKFALLMQPVTSFGAGPKQHRPRAQSQCNFRTCIPTSFVHLGKRVEKKRVPSAFKTA